MQDKIAAPSQLRSNAIKAYLAIHVVSSWDRSKSLKCLTSYHLNHLDKLPMCDESKKSGRVNLLNTCRKRCELACLSYCACSDRRGLARMPVDVNARWLPSLLTTYYTNWTGRLVWCTQLDVEVVVISLYHILHSFPCDGMWRCCSDRDRWCGCMWCTSEHFAGNAGHVCHPEGGQCNRSTINVVKK